MVIVISVGICLVLLGAQIFLRSFVYTYRKEIAYGTVLVLAGTLLFQTFLQYNAWKVGGLGEFLLPPHNSIGYFLIYVFFRIWAPYFISFLFGLLLVVAMKWGNRKKEGVLFFDDEYTVGFVAMVSVGYPALILFVLIFLFVYTSILFFQRKQGRFSSYFLWLPVALCAILLSEYICEGTDVWALLSI